ncbi:MAG: peptidoglycan-binding protein [Faecalibacterium sp.]
MPTGFLRIQTFAAQKTAPIPDVTITVTCDDFTTHVLTDAEGNAADIGIEAPDASFSLDEFNSTVLPYALCDLTAYKEGYQPITIYGSQIFAGQVTLASLTLIPLDETLPRTQDAPVDIPVHSLFAGDGGNGPAPLDTRVLNQVVIPTTIKVKLGTPTSSASIATVSFREYIANVASSEIYPTWPEQAIRANIYCQISCVLNRIYTEWYTSKGYSFDITSSPSYDQYYVAGRTIFATMERIANEIFDTFIRKTGTVNPYYAGYCDGKLVNCAGLKQWGTVDLANAGRSALQILQNYYTSIELARSTNIAAIQASYPGTALRQGSTGSDVSTLQRQLNRIAKAYPAFGTLTVDGIFGASMAATVVRFQRQFNLTADGIVGRATWYQISYIYVSVTNLAELNSEGETSNGGNDNTVTDGAWGGTVLRVGSRGTAVEQVQYWLSYLAQFYDDLIAPTVDGIYGNGTAAAVTRFQQKFGLTADGIVGQITWNALFNLYDDFESDFGIPNVYPGTALRLGAVGNSVRQIQFWLNIAADNYSALGNVSVDGNYGPATELAVQRFQSYFGLTADGVVGRITWEKLYEVYLDITNDLLSPGSRPGTFPGTLRQGSTGTAVRELQYYLYLLGTYESSIPAIGIDGNFGAATLAAVRAFQAFAGLTVDGIVGAQTWNALYQLASRLRASGEVLTITSMPYPGAPLTLGDYGEAVGYFSLLLERIAFYYPTVQAAVQTYYFDDILALAVESFQSLCALPITGVVDETTWNFADEASLTLIATDVRRDTLASTDDYPGYAAAVDSAGAHVGMIQEWLNCYAAYYPQVDYLGEGGCYTQEEEALVTELQCAAGLMPHGVVDAETWELLRPYETEV